VIGGHIEMDSAGSSSYWDRTAVKIHSATGVVHLEGFLINGAYLADGIVTSARTQRFRLKTSVSRTSTP